MNLIKSSLRYVQRCAVNLLVFLATLIFWPVEELELILYQRIKRQTLGNFFSYKPKSHTKEYWQIWTKKRIICRFLLHLSTFLRSPPTSLNLIACNSYMAAAVNLSTTLLHYLFFIISFHLQESKKKKEKVLAVQKEIRDHLSNLPDLTQLPDVTGGLAPLPSAGDLFSIH